MSSVWTESIGLFQAGDKVRLSDRGKRAFRNSSANPYELEGTINRLFDYLIVVYWDSGLNNSYIDSELELVL